MFQMNLYVATTSFNFEQFSNLSIKLTSEINSINYYFKRAQKNCKLNEAIEFIHMTFLIHFLLQ